MINILGINIKSSTDKLIDEIEKAYSEKEKIIIHISKLNKKVYLHLQNNSDRFGECCCMKSKYDLMREKLFNAGLFSALTSINVSEDDLEKKYLILDFKNRKESL